MLVVKMSIDILEIHDRQRGNLVYDQNVRKPASIGGDDGGCLLCPGCARGRDGNRMLIDDVPAQDSARVTKKTAPLNEQACRTGDSAFQDAARHHKTYDKSINLTIRLTCDHSHIDAATAARS